MTTADMKAADTTATALTTVEVTIPASAEGGTAGLDRVRIVHVPAALDAEHLPNLEATVRALATDTGVGAIVFAGGRPPRGDDPGEAFCRGLGLPALRRGFGDLAWFGVILAEANRVLAAIDACPQPTIAAVGGLTQLLGLEVALACDLLLVADDAEIGDVHTAHLVPPANGGTVRLLRRIGEQRTRELVLSGRTMTGTEAAHIGLALRSVPFGELETEAVTLAAGFAARRPTLLAAAKAALGHAVGDGAAEAGAWEVAAFVDHLQASPEVTSMFAG